jgi:poly-gamma-glutamate synthesis protein (capsule biosynthesis protein)
MLIGDLLVDRDNPDEAFDLCRDAITGRDITFGNLEGAFSDGDIVQGIVVAPLKGLDGIAHAGFDILSCANNHIVDAGEEALLTMLDRCRSLGMTPVGAGRNLEEARRPVYLEANGWRVAFVATASVFPYGYEATPGKPGLAPLRAHSTYFHSGHIWRPGMLPEVRTITDAADLTALVETIAAAKAEAHVVVASFHWGDHTRPGYLTDFELRTAREAIDAGADVIVGHHQHLIRGVDVYKGKPILYGLGHFVFDLPATKFGPKVSAEQRRTYRDYGLYPRPGYPLLPFHADGRLTVAADVEIAPTGEVSVKLIPFVINPQGQPYPLAPESREAGKWFAYLKRITRQEELNIRYQPEISGDSAGYRVQPREQPQTAPTASA